MALTIDQQKVIDHESGNILVSASAGSGKTFTIIRRIINLIIKGKASVNQLLAVTFTEKAATEMKEKLKNAISERIKATETPRQTKEYLANQLKEIATADISTMHAFCSRLIRKYFFVVGVAPDVSIADEVLSSALKKEAIDLTLKDLYKRKEEWFEEFLDRYFSSRSDKKIKEIVIDGYNFCDSEANPEELMDRHQTNYSEKVFLFSLKTKKEVFNKRAIEVKNEAIEHYNAIKNTLNENCVKWFEKLIFDLEKMIDCNYYGLMTYRRYKHDLWKKGAVPPEFAYIKERASALRDTTKKIIEEATKCSKGDQENDYQAFLSVKKQTDSFVKIIKEFKAKYTKLKQDENVIDFNDLEHYALEILKDKEIRQAVKEKYKYLFIDEYQDTNGVQEEIISLIENDNLLMVGDVKQSIYGFRGCRSEFFSNKLSKMHKNAQTVVLLNKNFRSLSAVIDGVNDIFDNCMTEDFCQINYKDQHRLIGSYPENEKNSYGNNNFYHINTINYKKEDKKEQTRLYDILNQTSGKGNKDSIACLTAKKILQIINEECTKSYFLDGKERKITLDDIAILSRTRSSDYIKELTKELVGLGVNVSTEVEENICDFPDVITLINALKLIDNFHQDVPLVSTLKSPIGNFTDEELLQIHNEFLDSGVRKVSDGFSKAFDYAVKNSKTKTGEKVKEFYNYFSKLRFRADFLGASGILIKLKEEKNIESHLLADKFGQEAVNRINCFISASVVDGRSLTVKEFLNRIENCKNAFTITPFAKENAVKLMTIHASKGLEFPVVIICGLERKFNHEDVKKPILFSRKWGFSATVMDKESRTFADNLLTDMIKNEITNEDVKEECRLFYVATTRAKYSLHMIFVGDKDVRGVDNLAGTTYASFIHKNFPVIVEDANEFSLIDEKAKRRKVIIGKPDYDALQKMQKDFAFIYPYQNETTLSLKKSVTAVTAESLEEGQVLEYVFDEESTDIERGNVAHKIMEKANFNGAGLKEQIQDMVKEKILTKAQVNSVNVERLENAFNCQIIKELNGYQLYKEQPFLLSVPAKEVSSCDSDEMVVVQGIIDLLAIRGDNAVIVDYKYSALKKESLKIKYTKQLQLYAQAVERVLNKKVCERVIINLFTGEWITC